LNVAEIQSLMRLTEGSCYIIANLLRWHLPCMSLVVISAAGVSGVRIAAFREIVDSCPAQ